MNEDGTPIEAPAEQVDGGESTTPEEVSQILGLNPPETTTEEPETPEAPEEEEVEEPEAPEEPETPEEEAPPEVSEPETPVEEPTFTMEVEDADGNKHTISSLEDLPRDFEPKDNLQIMEILQGIQKLDGERQAYESDKTTKAEEAEKAERVASIQESWDKEIKTLQADKRMPTDGKFDERRDAVFKFMAEENAKRNEDGRPLLQSFEDALDKLENREGKEQAKEAEKKEKELARQRGALVGGSSAPGAGTSPVYRSGSARNSSEAIRAAGLL